MTTEQLPLPTNVALPGADQPAKARQWFFRHAWRFVCFVGVPLLLTVVYVRYAVPTAAEARGTVGQPLAQLANDQPVLVGVGLFLAFSLLFRYWRFHLPGARWLVASGDLADRLRRPADWKILTQRLFLVVGAVGLAALAATLVRSRVVTPVRVLSASMLPTLTPRDLLLADRLAYSGKLPRAIEPSDTPRRGDIVVFHPPQSEGATEPFIKRVIGLPGDRIAMHGSRPVINGWEVPSCDAGFYLCAVPDGAISARLLVEFLEDRAYLTIAAPPPREFATLYEVQPNEVFVLGDNRNNSSDSRAWNGGSGGGVTFDRIEGRARWFLLGERRNQRADATRLLQSIDSLALHLEGVDLAALRENVAACLAQWPKETRVPSPNEAPAPPLERKNVIGE